MAYFAKIDENNVVVSVISISNNILNEPEFSFPDTELLGQKYINEILGLEGIWYQTSYNNNFRKRFAGEGYKYDSNLDEFITPQPYPSWILNEDHDWESPVLLPNDGNFYDWDEETKSWVIINN